MPEFRLIHAPGSCALQCHGVPVSRCRARSRAAATRSRMVAESRESPVAMSARVGVCTSMRMSMRSSNGPDRRAM